MSSNKSQDNFSTQNKTVEERVYDYLKNFIAENGYSPSVREITAGTNIKSTSTVHAALKKMNDLGILVYAKGKRRAISLNDSGSEAELESDKDTIKKLQNKLDELINSINSDETVIPLVGTITAGRPIYAYEDIEEYFRLPERFLSRQYKDFSNFLLKIRGDSMRDAGILDGDFVLIESRNFAEPGEIVAAMIGEEATVKRLGKEDGRYYLFPANEKYQPIPFNSKDCYVIGVVKSLFRINM